MSLTPLSIKAVFQLLLAFSFWLLTCLYHLKFSLFLVNPLETTLGIIRLQHYAPHAGYLLLGILAVYLLWNFKKGAYGKTSIIFWLIWLVLIAVINRHLLATSIENIHFLQYGLLATLLLWTFDGPNMTNSYLIPKVLFWATLAGIADEVLQYLWITASYSKYMDFNDFLLNIMGAIAGIMFYTSFKPLKTAPISPVKTITSLEAWVFYILSFAVLLFYYFDRIKISTPSTLSPGGIDSIQEKSILFLEREPGQLGSWQPAFNGGEFYVLAPLSGGLLLFSVFLSFIILNSIFLNNKAKQRSPYQIGGKL